MTYVYTLNLEPGNTCSYLAKMCNVSSDLVCYNGASCWCDNDVAKCYCFYGYTGDNCEIPPGIHSISFLQQLLINIKAKGLKQFQHLFFPRLQ